jgi:hypothetical protein
VEALLFESSVRPMMTGTLDELYLRWLYGQISPVSVKNPSNTYWAFAKQLFTEEFVWFIPNDDNRIADGKDLREEFLEEVGVDDADILWLNLGCSMLELMIGLSRRLSFLIDESPRDSFWILVSNLGIEACSDRDYEEVPGLEIDISEILHRVIWRTYEPSGEGGLFPLESTKLDQRKLELWYQMSAYVQEREEV